MPQSEIFVDTYGELASRLEISVSWAKKLWKRHQFRLEHRIGKKGRLRMTTGEFDRFKKIIKEV